LPVDDEHLLLVVVHPAATDVERLRGAVEIEPAVAESPFGVRERPQAASSPRLERERSDLSVGGVGRAHDRRAHPLEALVRVVDVRLLRLQLGMGHRGWSG
jgi:hypothetical protein